MCWSSSTSSRHAACGEACRAGPSGDGRTTLRLSPQSRVRRACRAPPERALELLREEDKRDGLDREVPLELVRGRTDGDASGTIDREGVRAGGDRRKRDRTDAELGRHLERPAMAGRELLLLPARPPTHTGPTVWITYSASRLPAVVAFASPVSHPPSRRHSSRIAGPPRGGSRRPRRRRRGATSWRRSRSRRPFAR